MRSCIDSTIGLLFIVLMACPLNINAGPANDNFANRAVITGTSNTVTSTMVGATVESGEPNAGVASVWWTWTAPSNLTVFLDVPNSSGCLSAYVYTGNSLASLESVFVNTNYSFTGSDLPIQFAASAGTAYQIALELGSSCTPRTVSLSLNTLPTPPNDNFSNCTPITTLSYTTNASNVGATREPGEPDHGTPLGFSPPADPGEGEGNTSVWWSYTAPVDGYVDVSVPTTNMIPLIAVYQGLSVSNLENIAKNTVSFGPGGGQQQDYLASNVRFSVLSNMTYYIAVDGFSKTAGSFSFNLNFGPAVMNNYFADRISLASNFTTITGDNLGANLEPNEPAHLNFADASVWWSWTAPKSAPVMFTTSGSSFDTVLEVYSNSTLNSLSIVASNDNQYTFDIDGNGTGPSSDPVSRVLFNSVAGTTYQIAVSGVQGGTGGIVLNNLAEAIDSFITNQTTTNLDGSVPFTNVLHLTNLTASATGLLRVRLLSQPGYSYLQYSKADQQFLGYLTNASQQLAVTNLPGPGNLAANGSSQITVAGICPPPSYSGIQTMYSYVDSPGGTIQLGIGYSVLAVLEEQVAGVWQMRDLRLILTGNWPTIGGFQGPGGGVITLAASPVGVVQNPALLQVNLGPPAALRLGGAWRVSPTNFGEIGELRPFTNYLTNASLVLAVQSTNFSVETKSLAGFISPGVPSLVLPRGAVTPLNLLYSVVPPRLVFNPTKGLGVIGTPGTTYRIETVSKLPAQANWTPLASNTLVAGTNWITNTVPAANTNRFYRSIWLTN